MKGTSTTTKRLNVILLITLIVVSTESQGVILMTHFGLQQVCREHLILLEDQSPGQQPGSMIAFTSGKLIMKSAICFVS